MVIFTINIDDKRQKVQRMRHDYRKANFQEMREAMAEIDWKNEMDGLDVNAMWQLISTTLKSAIDTYIPIKKSGGKTQPVWFDNEVKKCIEMKRRAWKTWKEKKTEATKIAYNKAVAETKKKIRKKKNATERKIAEKRKTNPKLFFSFINSRKKARAKIGPLNDDAVTDPKEQAQILNDQYTSVFTQGDDAEIEPTEPRTEKKMENICITEEIVMKKIEALNEVSATGPDGIPARVLKELKNEIVTPLTILFQTSIANAQIPDEWRDAEVTPIYKKGKKSVPGNYRPVSLTSIVGKMLERIVKEQLTLFVECNKLLSNAQHGFRPGRSPQTNLIEYLNTLTKWIDAGRSFDVIYLDFSKAFDRVCHKRLLAKLEAIGITGTLKRWLADWLRARRQRVKVEEEVSEWAEVASSVIQGSVLGGTLFDIYIDDIIDIIIEALASIFADDTKVGRIVETEEDGREMQKIVENLGKWADKWRMEFNAEKCKVMHFGNKNPRIKYEMNGYALAEAKEEKDLGVWINPSLKPSKQCATAAKAAHVVLGQIQRSFHFRSKQNLVPLYKSFVRPKLEFAVAAWSPWTEADAEVLEGVQKRLVRLLSNVRGNSYEEKLRDAGLTTLKERRRRGDAIETFKTINGFNKVEKDTWFNFVEEDARPTRANTNVTEAGEVRKRDVLKLEKSKLEVRKNSFTVRAAREWNRIPEIVRSKTSVNAFKNAYDAWCNGGSFGNNNNDSGNNNSDSGNNNSDSGNNNDGPVDSNSNNSNNNNSSNNNNPTAR